jgi:hypothetical protein
VNGVAVSTARYTAEQHLIAEPMRLERLFVPLPGATGS